MPCRRGCSAPRPGPVCWCARRGGGSGRGRRSRDQLCTADTCSNPEFCITYRPQFCPHPPLNQDNSDTGPPQFGNWPPPPPFPDVSMPWPPQHPHPLSSTQNPLHSPPSFPLHSLTNIHQNGNHPNSAQAGNTRPSSTARLSIGKPSITRLDSDHNPVGLSGSSRCGAMRQRLASIGRPSITNFTNLDGCCQTEHSNFEETFTSPNGAGVRYSDLASLSSQRFGRESRAQPIGRFQQAQQDNKYNIGSDRHERPEGQREGCACRMPPAFARLRCTGNLSGLCDCPDCDTNK